MALNELVGYHESMPNMKIITDKRSPNLETTVIQVEFVVLHYTACSLEKELRIFCSPETRLATHFVLDPDGTVYDMGDCLNGPSERAPMQV